jgi:hypothetical protein
MTLPHLQPPESMPPEWERDERYTQLPLFLSYHQELRHTLDAAGCPEAPVSRLIGRWCGRGGLAPDGLSHCWDGEVVWVNGPFSNIRPWIEKAWASRAVVDQIWPANRTEQGFWQELVEPYRDRLGGVLRCQFVSSRQPFGSPADPHGDRAGSPPFGIVRLTWTTSERPYALCPPPPTQRTML